LANAFVQDLPRLGGAAPMQIELSPGHHPTRLQILQQASGHAFSAGPHHALLPFHPEL
jgi:hypothetical protein